MSEQIKCALCSAECIPQGCAIGYAIMPDSRKICYACADARERESMKTAAHTVCYVGKGIVTTWTGGKLGAIVSKRATSIFDRAGYAYQIVDVHGAHWHGRHAGDFAGEGMALRIHRCK